MKRVLTRLGVAALLLGLLGGLAPGQSILVLSEQCNNSVAYFPAALAGLGLEFTETNDDFDFFLALTEDGLWDLVIVDEYSSRLDLETLDAMADYVASGGRVYMNYWDWDEDFAAAFEAVPESEYDEPLSIYVWDTEHPLFTTPKAVTLLQPKTDTCIVDGFLFSVTGGGTAVAGYSAAPEEGQSAIIIGNEGRTVLFGGMLGLFSGDENGDGRQDGLEFAENVIAFLLAVPIVRPRPPLWAAITPADIDRLLSEMELSFEQATSSEDHNPVWAFELAGVPVGLFAYNRVGDGYSSLRLYSTWPTPAQGAIPLINAWNLANRGSRAYVTPDGEIALDADLYLVGGVNWRAVGAFIERFEQAISDFGIHLGQ